MTEKEKKLVQVQIDRNLVDNTEKVLKKLNLDPTTAITMFYKKIVATGSLPFGLDSNQEVNDSLRFLKATEDTPVTEFKNAQEVADWLNDPNED